MKELKQFEEATEKLVNVFLEKYFCDKETKIEDLEVYWVCDEIGGVLCVGDYFFNLDRIVESIRLDASVDKLFEYYDLELDWATNDESPKWNFSSFIKLKVKPQPCSAF